MASRAATGRAIAIVVGLVLALVSAFLVWRYVSAADQRAMEGAELVDVFVATTAVPAGTTVQNAVSQQWIEAQQLPTANRPETAVTNLTEIAGLAALDPIQQGAILQIGQFGDPAVANAEFTLDEGQVALTVQVGIPEGVGGYLTQGDTAGIIAHIDAQVTTAPTLDAEGNVVEPAAPAEATVTRTQFLGTGEVLAIGQRVVSTDDQGNRQDQVQQGDEQVLATLSVTPADAERIVFAQNEGLLYFTLLPDGAELGDTPSTQYDSLFEG